MIFSIIINFTNKHFINHPKHIHLMKVSSNFFYLCFVVFLASCGGESTEMMSDFAGTWSVIEVNAEDGYTETIMNGDTITGTFKFYGKDISSEISFEDNPNTFSSIGSYTQVLTTTIQSTDVEEEKVLNDFPASGIWEATSTLLSLTTTGQPIQTATIVEMNGSTLKLAYHLDKTTAVPGGTVTQTATINYTLEKK